MVGPLKILMGLDDQLFDALTNVCSHILAGTADPDITWATRQSSATPPNQATLAPETLQCGMHFDMRRPHGCSSRQSKRTVRRNMPRTVCPGRNRTPKPMVTWGRDVEQGGRLQRQSDAHPDSRR